MLEIVSGWEPREAVGFQVAQFSAIRRTTKPLRFVPLMEAALRYSGMYWRKHEQRDGQLWDVVSDAPMSTSFACSRFLLPWLAEGKWALFCDFVDMLFLADPTMLFACAKPQYAVMVVKHAHVPAERTKMDGQPQTVYARKNWSSVILWNREHPAHKRLTQHMVNTLPGRDLHRFCWLEDDEIGSLPPSWNYLVEAESLDKVKPRLLHFTLGTPEVGRNTSTWADRWLRELEILDSTRANIMTQRQLPETVDTEAA